MLVDYDLEGDTLTVSFEFRERLGAGRQLDMQRILLYDQQEELVGVEFLAASKGIDLTDVPRAKEIYETINAFKNASDRLVPAPVHQ